MTNYKYIYDNRHIKNYTDVMTDDGYVGMAIIYTVCPRSLDPSHIVSYYKTHAKTFWTYSTVAGLW